MGIQVYAVCALLVASALPAVFSQDRSIPDVDDCPDCSVDCDAFVSLTRSNLVEFDAARGAFFTDNRACRLDELENGEERECVTALDTWKTACLNRRNNAGGDSPDSTGLVCENRITILNGNINATFVDYPCILSVCMEPSDFNMIEQLVTAEFSDCQLPNVTCVGNLVCNDNEDFRFADPLGSSTSHADPQVVAFSRATLALVPSVALLVTHWR